MATTYVWVGGHTGFTGTNSGYSATGGGASGTSPRWTSVLDGTTSDVGDFVFSPYYWGNLNNWRKAIQATGSPGAYNWTSASVFPKGGDTVIFTGAITGASGATIKTYSVSCRYGGMSGDGFTAGSGAGSTGWIGGWTAGSGAHTAITFRVEPTFDSVLQGAELTEMLERWGTTLHVGEIGIGATSNFDAFSPLKIRTSQFTVVDASTAPGRGARIALDNILSASGNKSFAIAPPQIGYNLESGFKYATALIKGYWNNVWQQTGTVLATDVTNVDDNGSFMVYWYPVRFGTSSTTSFRYFTIQPQGLSQDGYIYGNSGSQAEVAIAGYNATSNNAITLGAFNDGSLPTFQTVALGGVGGSTGGFPYVKVSSCQIDKLSCYGGTIAVSPYATQYDYPIIRDGFIKGDATLDMSHPIDPSWQNFKLAYSGGDEGLRVDSPSVTIRAYSGASFKTGNPEPLTGS